MLIRVKGKGRVEVKDGCCLRRPCLAVGVWHTRGATSSGSRYTGHNYVCCLTRANHGCPQVAALAPDEQLALKAVARPGEVVEWGAGKEGRLMRLGWRDGQIIYHISYQPPGGVRRTRVVLTGGDGVRKAGAGGINPKEC